MELALSLGDSGTGKPPENKKKRVSGGLNFCIDDVADDRLGPGLSAPAVQLDLLPLSSGSSENGSSPAAAGKGLDVNRSPSSAAEESAPLFGDRGGLNLKRHFGGNDVVEGKKLRLTKEQSAFLEESFKEHHTLNPKQKLALAKQLNLRPRQVEVWFQNRRARTKLKQTEVDCEYLKRWCETLSEENRRLQKEVQELRALKAASGGSPFYGQLPATALTMCPACERVATAGPPARANFFQLN